MVEEEWRCGGVDALLNLAAADSGPEDTSRHAAAFGSWRLGEVWHRVSPVGYGDAARHPVRIFNSCSNAGIGECYG